MNAATGLPLYAKRLWRVGRQAVRDTEWHMHHRDVGAAWAQVGQLVHKLEHHLKEEEEKWFPVARKVLPRSEQKELGQPYQQEHDRLKAKEESEAAEGIKP